MRYKLPGYYEVRIDYSFQVVFANLKILETPTSNIRLQTSNNFASASFSKTLNFEP